MRNRNILGIVNSMGINKVKIILCTFIFFLIVFPLVQAAAPAEQWSKTFGGVYLDTAYSVQQTFDGGYIIAGTTADGPGTFDSDGWLIKTDSSGNEQWSKTFGGTKDDVAFSVQQTSDDGYIIAGRTYSYGAGSYDAWLIKTDSSGDEQWSKTFGGLSYDTAYSVQQTSDGGYIIAGSTESYGAGNVDAWLIKTDSSGNEQWSKTFGDYRVDNAFSVQQTSDGGYILAGDNMLSGLHGFDAWLIKVDSSGNEQWSKTFGISADHMASDTAFSVQQTSDDSYIVAGYTTSYGAGLFDAWLIKFDNNGNQQWDKTFGGSDSDYAWSVDQTSDGGYIIAGSTESYGAGSSDAWLIKTDSIGNEQWSKTFGGINYEWARFVHQTSDGGYIVAGETLSYGAGYTDVYLIKVATENNPPVTNAGGPYQTTEGSAITFDASVSSDPDGDALQYRWDFESDGTWTEWSNDPKATHTWNDDWSGAITLEVRDSEFTSTAVADVTVTNANPIVETGNDQNVNEGTEVIFSGNYNDAGTADIHTIAWDFGDSSTASDTLTPTHVYADNGEYTVTLTVTDNDGGVGTDTLTVTVNNVNPVVGDITSPLDPHEVNTPVSFSSTFTDVGILDTHTAVWDFGDGTTAEGIIVESNGAGTVTGEHPYANAGIYWVTLTATDDDGGSTSVTSEYYIVIYDPEGGFVTGGGWIDSPAGSYVADPALTGKATFGFVSKYKKGATVPTGNTEFQFKVANLNFKSTSYDWLVIAGAQAKYKGTGTINGAGDYGFMLTAVDGAIKGDNVDKFRIKIWDKASGEIVYDNQIGVSEDAEPTTAIGGGSIVVHKVK